jgi:serine/threonine-protein kinase
VTSPDPPAAGSSRTLRLLGVILVVVPISACSNQRPWDALVGLFAPHPIRTVTVLPLQELSGDPEQAFLAPALTEGLARTLGGISALRIKAAGSAAFQQGEPLPADELGRALGVDAILHGTVLRDENQLHLTLHLVEARSGRELWTASYASEVGHVPELQRQAGLGVAQAIEAPLSEEEAELLGEERWSVDPLAYEFYWRGYEVALPGTQDATRNSIRYIEHAIQLDPAFAPAYVGLANAFIHLESTLQAGPANELLPRARDAALQAVALDDRLADAHAALAWLLTAYDHDWSEAEWEYQRALELNPSSAPTHAGYALHLAARGRMDEALAELDLARELDAFSTTGRERCGEIGFLARQYETAIACLEASLVSEPGRLSARLSLARALAQTERQQELRALVAAMPEAASVPSAAAQTAALYALAGRRADAQRLLDDLLGGTGPVYVEPFSIALVQSLLGNGSATLVWLERASVDRSSELTCLALHPEFERLQGDARFEALVDELGATP